MRDEIAFSEKRRPLMARFIRYKKILKGAGPSILIMTLLLSLPLPARGGSEYELISGAVGIASEINGGEYGMEGFIEYSESGQYKEYVLLSGGVGIASESSGGEYTQVGSVVLTGGLYCVYGALCAIRCVLASERLQ
jgi:hypothetical protein